MVLDYYKPEKFFKNNKPYSTHKALFDKMLDMYNRSEDLKDQITGKMIENDEQTACTGIFFKSQQTIISILILCNEGNRNDAGMLLRSLYENYIQNRYIIKHKKGLEFLNYLSPARKIYFNLDYTKELLQKSLNDEQYEKIENEINRRFEEVKSDYLTKNGKIRDKWSNVSLKDMAIDLDECRRHDFIMKTFSADVHCDIFGIKEMIISERTSTIFDNSPKVEGLDTILNLSHDFFGRIATELALLCKVGIPDIFRQFIKRE